MVVRCQPCLQSAPDEHYNDSLRDDFVTSRLNELLPAAKSILAWASMIGQSFSFKLVQRLLHNDFAAVNQDRPSDFPPFYSEQDTLKGFQAAIQAYIIVPTQNDDVFQFAYDRYVQAAASLWNGDTNMMHFVMAQTLVKYYSIDNKYRDILSSSVFESTSTIKRSVASRRPFRKLLLDYAHTAGDSGVKSTAVKLYASCIALLQDDVWNDEADDVYHEETLQVYTAAAECYLYRGQYQDARRLLLSVSANAKTAVDKAPSWILQSRMLAQEGDSTGAFEALKKCLVALGVIVENDPTFSKCDAEFKRLCEEIQSTIFLTLQDLFHVPRNQEIPSGCDNAEASFILVEASRTEFHWDTVMWMGNIKYL